MPAISNSVVSDEVMKAYADCHCKDDLSNRDRAMRQRQLQFKASEDVSVADAKAILAKAIPHGYNNFTAKIMDNFPAEARVLIAREYSVCLYVKGNNLPKMAKVEANECDPTEDEGVVRYWWD